jgi:hypothetical protein
MEPKIDVFAHNTMENGNRGNISHTKVAHIDDPNLFMLIEKIYMKVWRGNFLIRQRSK